MSLIARLLLVPLLALSGNLHAQQLDVRISSQFLVMGEQAMLEYVVPDGLQPGAKLSIPAVEGVNIREVGYGAEPRITMGRRREYVFTFAVSSYQPGSYTIPPAIMQNENSEIASPSIKLQIFNDTDLEWSTITVGETEMRCAAAFQVIDDSPFVNEVVPTELKVYIPASQRIEDWGIPEFDRDGVAAWRFEPRPSLGRAALLGSSYYAVSYPSTLSPTRAGAITLGPAKLRLITVQTSVRDFGSAFYAPANLVIPALQLTARELPPNAPAGFADAVGRFQLSVTASETEVREGDPLNLNIMVSGSGNLDTLDAPQPIDSEGWKLYPPSSSQLGERRQITGAVSFRQFMRPLKPQNQIPPFRLVYFDPELEEYASLLSNSIPLTVLPSTLSPAGVPTIPKPLAVPVEEMTDILGLINRGSSLLPSDSIKLAPEWWQMIPGVLALLLGFRILQLHVVPRFRKDPVEMQRTRDFRELGRAPSDIRGFYRTVGHFVERWLGDRNDPLARDILAKRDETCFRTDVPDGSISRSERQRILRGLRKIALPMLLGFASLAPAGVRAEDIPSATPVGEVGSDATVAYNEGRYGEAAALWLQSGPYERLSADTLYNIGNAAYRLGVPGEAALYWRRALARDSSHAEARQNIRFFERKFGSIAIKRPDYQYTLARVPLPVWQNLVWAGVWMIGLGLLVFPATRYASRLRIAGIASMVTAPLVIGAGACGWYYFPDDSRFAPLDEQAVIVADRGSVRTDAARNAPLVIEAPAGSMCRVINQQGDWTYVGFTNETRGWIPNSKIEMIVPDGPPEVPAIETLSDDDKSA